MGAPAQGSSPKSGDSTPDPDGLPVPRRYWAIATIVLTISMSVLDSSIANVALPSIARDFHASNAASIWVINAYQIAILAALLPLASLGETGESHRPDCWSSLLPPSRAPSRRRCRL
jgi:DHA2 family multidrug resistance protein-like MFS transporter